MNHKLTKAERDHEAELKRKSGIGQDFFRPMGYFRQLKSMVIHYPNLNLQQTLELMNNGDCATNGWEDK